MKKVILVLIFIELSMQPVLAQNSSGAFQSFYQSVLQKYSTYFKSADLDKYNTLTIVATSEYNTLEISDKYAIMNILTNSWQNSLIVVQYEEKKELWGRNLENNNALLLEKWDLNSVIPQNIPSVNSLRTNQHPWFFYLGGLFQLNTSEYINIAFNTRIGFFLLLNRWDLAATYSISKNGYLENSASTSISSIGMSSKIYFPVKKLRINPNLGVEISNNTSTTGVNTSSKINPFLLTGISWSIGHGSLDIGFRIGNDLTTTIGYTFVPGARHLKSQTGRFKK